MKTYINNIQDQTINNEYFREVLFTGKNMQLVVMNLKPGEEIGAEIHANVDQFFRVEEGSGKFVLDGESQDIMDDMAFIAPAGKEHNVLNTSNDSDLKLYTIYTPPEYPENTIHKTKEEADKYEHENH